MIRRQIFDLFSVYLEAFCFRKESSAPLLISKDAN